MNQQDGFGALDQPPWTISRRGSVVVAEIALPRLFDPTVVDHLDRHLRSAVGADDHLILDLSRVRFLSSAMLGRLVMLWLAAQKRGRQVVLTGVNQSLTEILRIAGLHQRVQAYADVATALATLSEQPS